MVAVATVASGVGAASPLSATGTWGGTRTAAHVSDAHYGTSGCVGSCMGAFSRIIPPPKRTGRPYVHDRRVVLEAIMHVMRTGCRWRRLPTRFPPWKTVYSQFTYWRANGIWAKIWENLDEPRSVNQLQL